MVLYILSKARPVQYCTGTTDLLFQGRPPHVLYGNLTVASSSQDMEAKKGSPKISSGGGGGGGGGGASSSKTNASPAQSTAAGENEHRALLIQQEPTLQSQPSSAGQPQQQIRQRLAIVNATGTSGFKDSIVRRLFPPGRKATGVRRYVFSLMLLVLVDTILWSVFAGVYGTSVSPVLTLSNDDLNVYEPRSCLVLSQRMDHDVSLAYFSLWRSEITVQYNTTGSLVPRRAQIHDSVTGIYGRLSVAIDFLDSFQVGRVMTCHVMKQNRYFAAVKGEEVLTPVIIGLVFLGLGATVVLWAIFRAFVSFLRFRRDFIWDATKEVWIVRRPR